MVPTPPGAVLAKQEVAAMMLDLVVQNAGKWQGRHIAVNHLPFLIGRDAKCNLRSTTPLFSKRHCILIGRAGKLYVRDLGSTNGTYLNNRKITEETELHQNERLRVGPVDFDVCIKVNPSPSERTPLPPTRLATSAREEEAAALLLSVQSTPDPASSIDSIDRDNDSKCQTVVDAGVPELVGTADARMAQHAVAQASKLDTPAAAADLLQRYLRRAHKKSSETA
jgi:pSer/pThr/pTyr-binding forkhead associated (FHA) protein